MSNGAPVCTEQRIQIVVDMVRVDVVVTRYLNVDREDTPGPGKEPRDGCMVSLLLEGREPVT